MPEGSSDLIDSPTNTNRTTLKIINDKYQDPIKAKVEYNKTTGLVEVTITYSKYGINKITFEDTTELQMTNTNGIITSNTEGITLEPGTYKITITDKNGIAKRLKVRVPLEYGREVLGYECDVPDVKWRLFHADEENIYLIADDYIPYANLPTSTNGTALDKGSTNYTASIANIIDDYTGSRWIIENTNEQAQKWLSQYLDTHPNRTDTSIKATAYMMDTKSWSKFAGEKAEYAIGGPTIELFCASYKQTHPDRYIECNAGNGVYGYYIKWSDDSYTYGVNGLIKDEYNSIYIKGTNAKAYGMWIASPWSYDASAVLQAEYGGHVGNYGFNNSGDGFRPIVCLKSGVGLLDNGDNTYSIKEPIMASAEYNETNGTIEITVKYTENGIAKIEDENGKAISYSNENGIIKAVTPAVGGRNKFTITDNKGIKKELEVKVPYTYGREVLGYECDVPDVKWRLFHEDDNNIYLIADDYIPYESIPTSTNGTALNKSNTDYTAYFTNILNYYTGSSWIRQNTNQQAKKWITWINRYPNSTNENMKAVAYMMDTNKWSGFAGEKAEYAIGGPTIDLFCASYKETHPSRYVECNSTNANGYQVKWSNGSYADNINGLTKDDFNSIYIKSSTTKAAGMWLGSPSTRGANYVMFLRYDGVVYSNTSNGSGIGFRPVVCLKSGTKLMDNGDNTYNIKEPIMANIEHKEADGTIEITIKYSENGIAKIEDENGKAINFTNENGIIKAVTSAVGGKHKFTITDNKGIIKELEIGIVLPVYATLYKDNTDETNITLAFTASNKTLEGKTVLESYGDISNSTYTHYTQKPWNSQSENITTVDIVDKIYPMSTAYWFSNCAVLTKTENISNLDTSNVTSMRQMFFNCGSLEELDLSSFDTSNVTDMSWMFRYCGNLIKLDLSNFDTRKVTNMNNMFFNCNRLIELKLINFNTSNVTDMSYMFRDCTSLTELDLNNFNTSNVTTMNQMFYACKSLTELDLSNFDTRNVTDMSNMFSYSSKLMKVYVGSSWQLADNISNMFSGCGTSTTTRK